MTSKIRSLFLSSTIIAVLLFSAVGPTTVYADDGTTSDPPATDTRGDEDAADEATSVPEATATAEPVETAVEDATATEVPATDTDSTDGSTVEATATPEATEATATGEPVVPAEDGTTTTDATSVPTDSQPTETVVTPVEETAPPADTNILEQVPENTTVTVLNADGQPQPLASQDAVTAIETTSDPIWCPATQTTPTPGLNGCTASFSSFTLLLTELAGNAAYQGAGTIYVEQGAYAGGESSIDFNSYNLSNIQNFDLTVTGGWNTTTNTVDPASSSTFNVPIIIGSSTNPWGGSLTINNIQILNPAQTGLTLYSQDNINISNVVVENSTSGDGAVLGAGVDVNINNSKFLRNNGAGARITAGRDVTIANSDFSNPVNQRRQITGLEVNSGGAVSLLNVLANGNRRRGADIQALGIVTISSSQFSETNGLNGGVFYGYGLRVVTPAEIVLNNVTANNNFLWGADLDAGGDVSIVDSIFNANSTLSPTFIDDTGLLITSGGNVALTNVQANGNRLIGTVIDAVGSVSIESSTFSNNTGTTVTGGVTTLHGLGLLVTSLDSIFLNNVDASNNFLFGAQLNAAGDVVITSSSFNNNTTGSATDALGYGLGVISGQSVFIGGLDATGAVTVDGNQLYGANIQAAGDVFLDLMIATNNGTDGVQTQASCTHLNGGTYSGNGEYGLNLINSPLHLTLLPTFANNGLGDISPATPATCGPVVGIVTPPVNAPTGGSGNQTGSGLQQTVSYSPAQQGGAASSVVGASLNSLFGITREAISGGVVTSIFVGNYVYVYTVYEDDFSSSIDNLQIIALTPAPPAPVAMVMP